MKRVIEGLKAKGFDGTIDRLSRGEITLEDAKAELAGGKPKNFKMPEPIDPFEFAAILKRQGVGRQLSWSRWIQRTSLRPGMDAKDWYKIYDEITSS